MKKHVHSNVLIKGPVFPHYYVIISKPRYVPHLNGAALLYLFTKRKTVKTGEKS